MSIEIPEPGRLLMWAVIALLCAGALLASGLRLAMLYRQNATPIWRRWYVFVPILAAVALGVLAVVDWLAYAGVALTRGQVSALDFTALVAWQDRAQSTVSAYTPWSFAGLMVTLAILCAQVTFIVLTPPKPPEPPRESE